MNHWSIPVSWWWSRFAILHEANWTRLPDTGRHPCLQYSCFLIPSLLCFHMYFIEYVSKLVVHTSFLPRPTLGRYCARSSTRSNHPLFLLFLLGIEANGLGDSRNDDTVVTWWRLALASTAASTPACAPWWLDLLLTAKRFTERSSLVHRHGLDKTQDLLLADWRQRFTANVLGGKSIKWSGGWSVEQRHGCCWGE